MKTGNTLAGFVVAGYQCRTLLRGLPLGTPPEGGKRLTG